MHRHGDLWGPVVVMWCEVQSLRSWDSKMSTIDRGRCRPMTQRFTVPNEADSHAYRHQVLCLNRCYMDNACRDRGVMVPSFFLSVYRIYPPHNSSKEIPLRRQVACFTNLTRLWLIGPGTKFLYRKKMFCADESTKANCIEDVQRKWLVHIFCRY